MAIIISIFFLQSFLLITQKMFLFLLRCVLFLRCFLFVLIKSKGTMASAATKITIFSSHHQSPFLVPIPHNMFPIPYSVGFQQICPPPPPCLFFYCIFCYPVVFYLCIICPPQFICSFFYVWFLQANAVYDIELAESVQKGQHIQPSANGAFPLGKIDCSI